MFDAFRAFNFSNSGFLNCSELYGGMDYLGNSGDNNIPVFVYYFHILWCPYFFPGIPFSPDQIYDLMRKIAIVSEGMISYEDFKRVFQGKNSDELESNSIAAEGGGTAFEPVPPKKIPEIFETTKVRFLLSVTFSP